MTRNERDILEQLTRFRKLVKVTMQHHEAAQHSTGDTSEHYKQRSDEGQARIKKALEGHEIGATLDIRPRTEQTAILD